MANPAASTFSVLRDAVTEFLAEDPFTHAAALSYYSLLSLAPLLVVVVAVAGIAFDEATARDAILTWITAVMGPGAAGFIADILNHARSTGASWLSAILGLVGVLVGATTAFSHLQTAINQIWGVTPPKRPIWDLLRVRGLAFVFVLLLGAAVIALLVATSVVSNLRGREGPAALGLVWRLLDLLGPLALMTALFAALFRWLPDARVRWRDAWVGALCSALLFALGRHGIGLYLGRAGIGSAYGAAGSAVIVMIWIYYSTLIVLFGAEVTQVRARHLGEGPEPRAPGA